VAQGLTCDRCGKALLVDEPLRYVVKVEVYAAYDPLEVTRREIEGRDLDGEIQRLLREIADRDARELEREVYERRDLDLCPSCRQGFLDALAPPAAPAG